MNFLENRNPFSNDPSLHSIATGVTAAVNVYVDSAQAVCVGALRSMVDTTTFEYSFKQKKAVTVVTSGVKIGNDNININPYLLFQRLIALKDKYNDTAALFPYRLCRHPAALFDDSGQPREANKPKLADAMWDIVSDVQTELPEGTIQYAIGGGVLLQ